MTAADLLLTVGKVNLAGAAGILIVLGLRKAARRWLGARLTYGLWLLPLVVMVACLAPARQAVVRLDTLTPAQAGALPAGTVLEDIWGGLFAGPGNPDSTPPNPAPVLLALWALGSGVTGLAMGRMQRRFTRAARDGAVGPAVVGLISPRIITPSDFAERFDAEEQALVLAHESTHIRRQDSRLNGLAAALQCLFWFNPLIHFAIRPMRIDQELACDEAVVSRFPDARAAYARALVKTQLANRPLPLGCYWPSGTRHPLLERIAMIKTTTIGARRRLVGASLVATLCAASAVAAWAASPARVTYEAAEPAPAAASAPVPAVEPLPAAPPAPAAAARQSIEAAPAAPAQVCISNSCMKKEDPEAGLPPLPFARVMHVGADPIPAAQPFAKYFNADESRQLRGRVTEVRMADGLAAELVVAADDGRSYRVIGGNPASLPAEIRANFDNLPGQSVIVRGYLAYDQSCQGGGCIINGRDVTFTDGSKIGATPPK